MSGVSKRALLKKSVKNAVRSAPTFINKHQSVNMHAMVGLRPVRRFVGARGRNGTSHRPLSPCRALQPCVLVTNTEGIDCTSLQMLAEQVHAHMGCAAVIVAPERDHPSSSNTPSTSPGAAPSSLSAAAAPSAAALSFGQPLTLTQRANLGAYTFSIAGSTADCILCAVDAKAGLLKRLGLTPVLTVVGVHRGPALSSDVDTNPAVMAARRAAVLGVPAAAICLATTSAAATLGPAAAAAGQLLSAMAAALRAGGGWDHGATNFPRAHFPFPTRGRWALGRELVMPPSVQAATASSSGGWDFAAADCWALGSDDSWLGGGSSGSSRGGSGCSASSSIASEEEGQRLLRQAFCEGDMVLCVNVPPTWQPQAHDTAASAPNSSSSSRRSFASTRVGVLWHCYQAQPVEAAQQGNGTADSTGGSDMRPGSQAERSWQASNADLFGRSLPSQALGQSHTTFGAFVAQDNTAKALEAATAACSAATAVTAEGQQQQLDLPAGFILSPGTLLNDHAVKGDVEAVFSGLASVCCLQTWPCGHPFSLTDAAMVHALAEGKDGLPAWLSSAH